MPVLRRLWSLWKRIGEAIGNLVGRLFLTIFYFTLLAPFGLGVRFWGDPLGIRARCDPVWARREGGTPSLDDARRSG